MLKLWEKLPDFGVAEAWQGRGTIWSILDKYAKCKAWQAAWHCHAPSILPYPGQGVDSFLTPLPVA
jgi:hypothetical protein